MHQTLCIDSTDFEEVEGKKTTKSENFIYGSSPKMGDGSVRKRKMMMRMVTAMTIALPILGIGKSRRQNFFCQEDKS